MQTLRAALPRETIVVSDLTVAAYWCRRLLDIYEPRTNVYPWGFCTLGFGLPAAIGAKVARPESPVVVLCGDGGFLFNCQELAAAVQFNVPIVVLVFNDSAYGVLRPQQEMRYGGAHAVDLVNPDFIALARAFGVEGCRVTSIEQLGPAVAKAIEADRITLIELPGKAAVADHGTVGAHVRRTSRAMTRVNGAQKLRVGFIGAGAITDLHYLGYKDNPKAELYAICDVDEALLQRRASEWQVEKTYTDYRQLLADPGVDAVGGHHPPPSARGNGHRRAGGGQARLRTEADGDHRGRVRCAY